MSPFLWTTERISFARYIYGKDFDRQKICQLGSAGLRRKIIRSSFKFNLSARPDRPYC